MKYEQQVFLHEQKNQSSVVSRLHILCCWVLFAATAVFTVFGAMPTFAALPEHSRSEALTQALLSVSSAFQKATPAGRAQALSRLEEVSKERYRVLSSLIYKDPKAFLSVVVPDTFRATLPKSVRPFIEEEVSAEGLLDVFHADYSSHSQFIFKLTSQGKRLELLFADDPPHVMTGTRVRVKGVRLENTLALNSGESDVETLAMTTPSVVGAQQTLVLLVNFADKASEPFTVEDIQSLVFSTTSNFYKENSYDQAWIEGDTVGWFTLPLSSSVCDYRELATQAQSAATGAGLSLQEYSRLVYVFPKNACTWWGLGSVGGAPSQSWVNDNPQLRVFAHELGHNYGLYHSHSLDCGAEIIGESCTSLEYGDSVDVMGSSKGHLNAFQKERLGWLNSTVTPPITTVLSGGQYMLEAYEGLGQMAKALKILKSTDSSTGFKTWYYLELRQPIGYDSWMSTYPQLTDGVIIHTGTESNINSSNLLDMNPATSTWLDSALSTGQSFVDADAGVTIQASSVDTSNQKAIVSVSLATPPCLRSSPALEISPQTGVLVGPGEAATYSLTLTNADGTTCDEGDFLVTITLPNGWSGSASPASLTIPPGGESSSSLQITSPLVQPVGTYSIPARVLNTDSNQASEIEARVVIAETCLRSAPTLLFTPDVSGPMNSGETFVFTGFLTNNDSSGCGEGTFTLQGTYPKFFRGNLTQQSLTMLPGETQAVAFSVKSPRKKLSFGSYPIDLDAMHTSDTQLTVRDTATYRLVGR